MWDVGFFVLFPLENVGAERGRKDGKMMCVTQKADPLLRLLRLLNGVIFFSP